MILTAPSLRQFQQKVNSLNERWRTVFSSVNLSCNCATLVRNGFGYSYRALHADKYEVLRFMMILFMLLYVEAGTATPCSDEFTALARRLDRTEKVLATSFNYNGGRILFGQQWTMRWLEIWGNRPFVAKFEKISSFDKKLRNHLKAIKSASIPNPGRQREVAEIIVTYRDGTTKAVRYTSNEFDQLSSEAGTAAVENAKLFENLDEVVAVTDIHTHPNKGDDTNLHFSDGDVIKYRNLKAQIEKYTRRKIPFRALVLPNCEDCEDVVVSMDI